jgi:hypothetical protein
MPRAEHAILNGGTERQFLVYRIHPSEFSVSHRPLTFPCSLLGLSRPARRVDEATEACLSS